MGLASNTFLLSRFFQKNSGRIIIGTAITVGVECVWELVRCKKISEDQLSPTAHALIDTAIAVVGVACVAASICCRTKKNAHTLGEGTPLMQRSNLLINGHSPQGLCTGTSPDNATKIMEVQAALNVATFVGHDGPVSANDMAPLLTKGTPPKHHT